MAHFTKQTVTIQPQAQRCMEKEHVSFEEILETLNEWESGEVQCTNIKDMMRITEYPETEDKEQIPTFCEMEKDFTDRRVWWSRLSRHNLRCNYPATINP